jgi:DNA mismatch repair protein MutS2
MRHYAEEAEQLQKELKEAYSYFFEEREKEMADARKKANQVVSEAEEKAEKIIADIRKNAASNRQRRRERTSTDRCKNAIRLHRLIW